jgi:hypothetical protein
MRVMVSKIVRLSPSMLRSVPTIVRLPSSGSLRVILSVILDIEWLNLCLVGRSIIMQR